jgi:hypothetical protein
VQFIYGRRFRNIFRDAAEMRAGVLRAFRQIRFAVKLVREAIALDHFARVSAGGGSEIRIPLQRGKTFGSTFVVYGVEKKFLVAGWSLLRKSLRGKNEKRKCEGEKIGRKYLAGIFDLADWNRHLI